MKFVHGTRHDFFSRLKDHRIICVGASTQLFEAVEILSETRDICGLIDAVIDNDPKKRGKEIALDQRILQVQDGSFWEIVPQTPYVVLVTSRFYYEITQQLLQIPGWDDTDIFAYACMMLDEEDSESSKYRIRVQEETLRQYGEYLSVCHMTKDEKQAKLEGMTEYVMDRRHRVLPSVVLMHSNICSLKCEQCCDLLPFTKNHYYIPASEIMDSLNRVLRGVDKCARVDLTDGETFLYKELDVLLEQLIANEKVETIFAFTNATILPDEKVLKLLAHPKCMISVSDYGLIEQMGRMVARLEKYHVNFNVKSNMVWMGMGHKCAEDIRERTEAPEWIRYDFLRCGNKKCSKALIGNRLYGCMPAFRLGNVGVFESERDYVEFQETDSEDVIWDKIYEICMTDSIDACRYCNFANTALPFCRAGKQAGLVQSNYTIVHRED